jgi:hypothetical protein
MDASNGVVVSHGSSSVTVAPGGVTIVNGKLTSPTISGGSITGVSIVGATITGTVSLTSPTITGGTISGVSLSIGTGAGTVSINSGTSGISISSVGGYYSGLSNYNLILGYGPYLGSLTWNALTLGGTSGSVTTLNQTSLIINNQTMIDASGRFVGNGIVMLGAGITATGFNPYVGGIQYTGAAVDITFKDSVGGYCTLNGSAARQSFKGGVLVGLL